MEQEPATPEPLVTPPRLRALRAAVGTGDKPLLIAIHDYPDPDAIAAGLAMQTLAGSWGIGSVIAHGGILGRAENAEMVRLLKIDLKTFDSVDAAGGYRGAVLLDTQPEAKNHSLPPGPPVLAVIDHHSLGADAAPAPGNTGTRRLPYADIRVEMGSSSTLMAGYLEAAGITPDKRLATAMFLGIKTDTDGLLRTACPHDVRVYTELMRLADLAVASRSIHPPLSPAFYRFIHTAVSGAGVYGTTVLAHCGEIETPDMLSTASDFLIPLRDIRCALAVGFREGRAFLSLRAKPVHDDAGGAAALDATRVLLSVVEPEGKGGGHNLSAGGFIELPRSPEECLETIRARLLEATGDTGNSRKALIE